MKNFIFIIGVEGSGTTMFCRILGRMTDTEVILGNYKTLEKKSTKYLRLIQKIEDESALLWSREASLSDFNISKHDFLNSVQELANGTECQQTKNLILKRSAPFYKDNTHKPDILDVLTLFKDAKVLVLIRDPKASTYSALRRNFVSDIRKSSIICDEHLTNLSAQLRAYHSKRVIILDYSDFCAAPCYFADNIAAHLDINNLELRKAIEDESISPDKNHQWKKKLSNAEKSYLNSYFSEHRNGKYSFLFENKLT